MKDPKSIYREKLQDPRWQKMRLKAFERDKWECRTCLATDKPLHAHHKVYKEFAEGPWDCDLADLVTLCDDCHDHLHAEFDASHKKLANAVVRAGFDEPFMINALADAISPPGALTTHDAFMFILAIASAMQAICDPKSDDWRALKAIGEAAYARQGGQAGAKGRVG